MRIRLEEVLTTLARQAQHAIERQVTAAGPDRGGVVQPAWGIAEPTGACGLVAVCSLLYIAREMHIDTAPPFPDSNALLHHAGLAAQYLLRVQRPSGLIDLRDCNYDSGPDAGFAVQAFCPIIELGRPLRGRSTEWDGILDAVELFVKKAAVGMLSSGFHTPNHRWVMAGAMAYAADLFPDLEVRSTMDAYLGEGFDVDADGAYIERSAGVYDAICDRSMLLLWEHRQCEPALRAAQANLALNLHLLHSDGTIETGASRRQDYGVRSTPSALALPYLMCHRVEPNPAFRQAAELLWERGRGDAAGLAWHLLRHPQTAEDSAAAAFPFDFRRLFQGLGLWRSRRGPLSATAFGGSTRLLTLVSGEAELRAVKISQSYFGTGRFIGDEISAEGTACVLRSDGDHDVHRPGYDMPLGRPVDRARWFETRGEREWRALPRCVSELRIEEADAGFDLRYRTLDGMPGVTAQVALDFAPGGVWETDDACLRPCSGQVIFLKQGNGAMRYGHDLIEIGPGAHAHRMWAMRDAEQVGDLVRVLLTFETPVRHVIRIRCRRAP